MRYSRQQKVIELITNEEIDTQENLAERLRDSGFDATQATVSRDIKELQLIKVAGIKKKYRYAVNKSSDQPVSSRFVKIFRETVTSVNYSMNMIVVKTLTGCANAAAEAIDASNISHIIGTLAGDNTLFLVADDPANVPAIIEEFNKMLATGPNAL